MIYQTSHRFGLDKKQSKAKIRFGLFLVDMRGVVLAMFKAEFMIHFIAFHIASVIAKNAALWRFFNALVQLPALSK